MHPAPAAGFVQAAGLVGFINLNLKAMDADAALDAVDPEVKPAVAVMNAELGLHQEILEPFLGQQDAVAAFALRAGADDGAVLHLPFAAGCGLPAVEVFAVEERLEFAIGCQIGRASCRERV